MDRILRPKTFETETTDPCAEKLFKHWKITFENFVSTSIPEPAPADPTDAAAVARVATETASAHRKKLFALINNVSASVYDLISDSDTYDAAMAALEVAYVRPTSRVFNRQQLMTCKQEPGQSVDTFLQKLHQLAKNCQFQTVTAEQYKNEYVRDAFINGINSSTIRQRILETVGELSLDQAQTQARALEQAQSHSASYETGVGAVAAIEPATSLDEEDNSLAAISDGKSNHNQFHKRHPQQHNRSNGTFRKRYNNNGTSNRNSNNNNNHNNNNNNNNNSCVFCGKSPYHDRSACPAKNDICNGCGKNGHWFAVCRSSSNVLGAVGTSFSNHTQHFPHLA